ncbi:hypothetical protein DQ393_30995 [Rhizobium tropici]|uniref:Uncharacterized protein n=1 Tax=Rhizobium tropici TaxID=398 RepID=A0A329Y5K0_RHITR|nr:hypothetical protein DQ393_30995 [Rhizobium tropici]
MIVEKLSPGQPIHGSNKVGGISEVSADDWTAGSLRDRQPTRRASDHRFDQADAPKWCGIRASFSAK